MENKQFIPYENSLEFIVIGCPIGHGPDINNFTCNPCGNQII